MSKSSSRIRSCLVLISILLLSSLWMTSVHASPAYPPVGSTSLINPTATLGRDDLYGGAFHPTDLNNAIIVGSRGKILKWNGTIFSPVQTGAWVWFYRAAWRPDGSYALLIGDNGGLEKWNGTYLIRVAPQYWATSPQGPVTYFENIAWKPDGSYALIVGEQGSPLQATVWKYDGSSLTNVYTASNSYFYGVAWKPDGSYALISGSSGSLYRYDGFSFTPVLTGISEPLYRVSWRPDGSYALLVEGSTSGSQVGKAFIYDGVSFTGLVSGLNYYFQDVAWKPGGGWALIPCYNDGLIYNFTGTGFTLLYNGTSTLGGVALNSAFWRPDGGLAFIAGEVGTVLKYDGSSFTTLSPLSFVTREILYGSAWKPDGAYALIVGGLARNGPAGVNLYGKGIIMKYDGSSLTVLVSGLRDLVRGVAWRPDGSYALICASNGTLIKFDGSSFTTMQSGTVKHLRNVAWKPDGSYALICGFGGTLLRCDGTTTTVVSTGISNDLYDVAWNPDGSYALICGTSGKVLSYDGSTLTTLTSGVSDTLYGLAYRPDGTQAVIVGANGRMLRYDGSTFTRLSSGTTSGLREVDWKPDGTYAVVVSTSNWLRVYDGSSVYGRQSFSPGELYTVAWKPDSSYALLGGNYGLLLRYFESPMHFYGAQYAIRNSDDNNLYFLLTGYSAAGKVPGVSPPSTKGSNMYAASLLYGLANRVQKVDYDTGGWVDHSTGKPLVSAISAGKYILIFGNPSVHNSAYYYTTVSNESPAYGETVGGYYRFVSRAGKVLYSQELSRVGDHEDSAILMMFRDADGRFVTIIYSVGYQGSWAAALYFKEKMWRIDSSAFDGTTYIVHWLDSNGDRVPQLSETYLIPLEESAGLQYQVTVSVSPVGSGSIVVDGRTVSAPYLVSWPVGSSHTVQALPLRNAPFSGWSLTGSLSCSNPMSSTATVTVNGPGTVTANFGSLVGFDYRLSNSGSSSNLGGITVARGTSGSVSVSVSLVNGPTQTVNLICSGASAALPYGVSCDFVPASGSPSYTSTLTVTVSTSATQGTYVVMIIGTAGAITRTTFFTLIVT